MNKITVVILLEHRILSKDYWWDFPSDAVLQEYISFYKFNENEKILKVMIWIVYESMWNVKNRLDLKIIF